MSLFLLWGGGNTGSLVKNKEQETFSFRKFFKKHNINGWLVFYLLIYIVLIIKMIVIRSNDTEILFKVYSITVSIYILSRFVISYFYIHDHPKYDKNYQPTISFGVPSKNEGENIRSTILRIAKSDYPKNKFDIIAVNDGSDDNTLEEMLAARKIAKQDGVDVKVINWKENKGKRDGMAECINQSKKEVMIFIDSDSFVKENTASELVKFFSEKSIGAVAGHAYVQNANVNMITKMQSARYYVAFKAYKGAESLFGTVTCCSGCCSAYRISYVKEILNDWLTQSFLGVRCTYGDDRSLTNYLLKTGYKTLYAPLAEVHTFVPETMRKFLKQQLRWKKSWIRESMLAGMFMWKKHPIMSASYYLGVILTLLAPIIVVRTVIWIPLETSEFPYAYLVGLLLMATIYGIYYHIYMKDRNWIYGVVFALFYTLVLIWQMPFALATLRDSRWGTR